MIKWLERRHWTRATFFISAAGAVHIVSGWTYKGLGIYQRKPNDWSITHLGTGHKLFLVTGKMERVMRIARRIANAADWHFNAMPENPEVYFALMDIVRREYMKYTNSLYVASHTDDTEYNPITAAAASRLNGVG